ncbi:hypothetical protein BDV10DRAFT_129705 [Aspergillus recurvatus]
MKSPSSSRTLFTTGKEFPAALNLAICGQLPVANGATCPPVVQRNPPTLNGASSGRQTGHEALAGPARSHLSLRSAFLPGGAFFCYLYVDSVLLEHFILGRPSVALAHSLQQYSICKYKERTADAILQHLQNNYHEVGVNLWNIDPTSLTAQTSAHGVADGPLTGLTQDDPKIPNRVRLTPSPRRWCDLTPANLSNNGRCQRPPRPLCRDSRTVTSVKLGLIESPLSIIRYCLSESDASLDFEQPDTSCLKYSRVL